MDIEIVEMADTKCKFVLKNSTPAMANALRRTMLSDIPKMAIDDVEFHLGYTEFDDVGYETDTPLFNEIIAHRLGMLPVPTDYSLFNFKDKCVCGGEGCPNCEIMYSLNEHGPKTVYSRDLQPLGGPNLKIKDEDIPIVELEDGQAVLIYAHAVMGTAKKHVKWQAANGVGYKYKPVIKIGDVDSPEEVAKACPKHVFDVDNGKLTAGRPLNCMLCKTCQEMTRGAITVDGDPTNFVFTFETDGSLTAQQVIDKAAEILAENAKKIADDIAAF